LVFFHDVEKWIFPAHFLVSKLSVTVPSTIEKKFRTKFKLNYERMEFKKSVQINLIKMLEYPIFTREIQLSFFLMSEFFNRYFFLFACL
jgi:hypothetical protein